MTEVLSFSDLRSNLKRYFDGVCENRYPLTVKRNRSEDVVILSKSDYDSLGETFYLLKSPTNAARLLEDLKNFIDE